MPKWAFWRLDSCWICNVCSAESAAADISEPLLKAELEIEKESTGDAGMEAMLAGLASTALHPNHFLLVRIKEKLVQSLMHKKESLRRQAELFAEIRALMVAVDPATEIWNRGMDRMNRKLEQNASATLK